MKDSRVASVQFEHLPGDKAANLAKVHHYAAEAAKQGAELVVCPEMCVTGYWFLRDLSRDELDALAEPIPAGPTTQELLRLAKEHGITYPRSVRWRPLDPNLFTAFSRPAVFAGSTVAVHVLSAKPLTGAGATV